MTSASTPDPHLDVHRIAGLRVADAV
jgi:hypothetical protein